MPILDTESIVREATLMGYNSWIVSCLFLLCAALLIAGHSIVVSSRLRKTLTEIKREVSKREQSEAELRESEEKNRAIVANVQAGIVIVDAKTLEVTEVNKLTCELLGYSEQELIGRPCKDFLCGHSSDMCPFVGSFTTAGTKQCEVRCKNGQLKTVIKTVVPVSIKSRIHLLESFVDVSHIVEKERALKDILEKQKISVDLAKTILNLINRSPTRHRALSSDTVLFSEVLGQPCYAEGGDHILLQDVGSKEQKKTVLSLKDQSGHRVNCVLRSIITDLMHHAILQQYPEISLEQAITKLNHELSASGCLEGDDFVTSFDLEIIHETLEMRYLSAGHPPALLIRGKQVSLLPEPGNEGENLPFAGFSKIEYHASSLQLQPGDKLILYTDGLTDMAFDKAGIIYSAENLRTILSESLANEDLSLVELTERLLQQITAQAEVSFIPGKENTATDDITLVCLEIEDCLKAETYRETLRIKDTDELCREIARISMLIEKQWSERRFESMHRVRLVIEESLLNAWHHGNLRDPSKEITIVWSYRNDFHLEVIDQGQGFDPESIPSPTDNGNITKTSGRGLFLLRLLATTVNWSNSGRHIHISCRQKPLENENDRMLSAQKLMDLWAPEIGE